MPARKPPYLTRLQVRNFRSLRSMDLRLGALNVLVGPNAAGKTNVLDVLTFLGDTVREDLGPAITERGGWERVRFRGLDQGVQSDPVVIEVHAAVTKNSSSTALDEYHLSIRPFTRRRAGKGGASTDKEFFRYENFMFKRTAGPGRRITIDGAGFVVADEEGERTGHLREGSLGLSTLPDLVRRRAGSRSRLWLTCSQASEFSTPTWLLHGAPQSDRVRRGCRTTRATWQLSCCICPKSIMKFLSGFKVTRAFSCQVSRNWS